MLAHSDKNYVATVPFDWLSVSGLVQILVFLLLLIFVSEAIENNLLASSMSRKSWFFDKFPHLGTLSSNRFLNFLFFCWYFCAWSAFRQLIKCGTENIWVFLKYKIIVNLDETSLEWFRDNKFPFRFAAESLYGTILGPRFITLAPKCIVFSPVFDAATVGVRPSSVSALTRY